ncbi:MAG: hypothetical protein HQ522_06895 [Bacteroidetes bacterium]|nr:hypothetical protein [Bacteroidota bacterium]
MTQLVKTIEDLKKHIAIDFIEGFDVLEFAIEDRELELVDKYIGEALMANLVKEYTDTYSNSLSSTEALYTKALWYCQRIISNYALLDYIPEGQLDISENGIRITSTENKKQAFPWQIEKLEGKYLAAASRNLEGLMVMLNNNIDVFSDWTSSKVYVSLKKHFVNSVAQFNEYSSKKITHILFIELSPVINYVEDFYIRSIVGDAFFDELQERIKDGEDVDSSSTSSTVVTEAVHYDKLFHLIKGAVAQFTSFEAAKEIDCDPEICEKKASHYVQRLVEYLNHNASVSLFTKYFESDKYTAPVDSESYTSGGGLDNSEFTGVYAAF